MQMTLIAYILNLQMIQYIYISDASQIYNKFREIGNLKKMLVIKSKILCYQNFFLRLFLSSVILFIFIDLQTIRDMKLIRTDEQY
jgi:hypothetical protein